MREFRFPLQFEEIPIGYCEGFSFHIPEQEFMRDDIDIWVEYYKREDDPETLHFGAWACIGDIQFRRLVLQGDAPKINNRDKQVDQIFSTINLSKAFIENVGAFAEWIDAVVRAVENLDEE